MTNYEWKLEKGKYSFLPRIIDKRFHTSQPDWAKYAVVLHELVSEEAEYNSTGSKIPAASEMLDKMSGDCQDQTLLLTNLYYDAGLDIRIVSLSKINEDKGHVLPQVGVPVDKNEATDILRDTYQDLFDTRPNKMAWTTSRKPYFLADPVWSDYIGDRSSLTGSYIEEDGNSWDFHRVKFKQTIDSPNSPSESSNQRSTASQSRNRSGEKMGFLESLDCFADAVAESL